jgi:uncharacterized membrane protein YtjA (UPF0391 family)
VAGSISAEPIPAEHRETQRMLRWALIFFIVAIIAAVLGFGGLAGDLSYIAKILFMVFIVIFLISLIYALATGKSPPSIGV